MDKLKFFMVNGRLYAVLDDLKTTLVYTKRVWDINDQPYNEIIRGGTPRFMDRNEAMRITNGQSPDWLLKEIEQKRNDDPWGNIN